MSLYSDAVIAINAHVEATQNFLDQEVLRTKALAVKSLRDECLEGVDKDSPEYKVCLLVSQTATLGRESDGYPALGIPKETREVMLAASKAGILKYSSFGDRYFSIGKLSVYNDCSGFTNHPSNWGAHYRAWDEASTYRKRNQSSTEQL